MASQKKNLSLLDEEKLAELVRIYPIYMTNCIKLIKNVSEMPGRMWKWPLTLQVMESLPDSILMFSRKDTCERELI